jgi:hypothetical protein
MKYTRVYHQFSLFGYQPPTGKVPISAERILQAKAMFEAGDSKGAAEKMREVREALENYEKRITSGSPHRNQQNNGNTRK